MRETLLANLWQRWREWQQRHLNRIDLIREMERSTTWAEISE